jgi:ketosteroid isomerase-like protein
VTPGESQTIKNVRAGYEAFNRGDFEGALELMHPDVEVQRAQIAPDAEPLRGVDAIKAWMLPDLFAEQNVELIDIIESGDKVFVEGQFRIRAAGSGIVFEDRGWHVLTIRDSKATRLELHVNRADAIEAAGLRSDDASIGRPNQRSVSD